MNCLNKHSLLALILLTASSAHAEIIHYTYDLSRTAAITLESLGTKFVAGCAVLAIGIVAAVVISKKK